MPDRRNIFSEIYKFLGPKIIAQEPKTFTENRLFTNNERVNVMMRSLNK